MSNKKQTAVEYLNQFLSKHCNPSVCDIEWSDFNIAINEAKAMEKEKMIDVLKSIEYQLSELQKQSSNPNSLTKRGGEYRIALSKAKDCINDNIYLIQKL